MLRVLINPERCSGDRDYMARCWYDGPDACPQLNPRDVSSRPSLLTR